MNGYFHCILSHPITTTNASANIHELFVAPCTDSNFQMLLYAIEIFFIVHISLLFNLPLHILLIFTAPAPRGSTLGPLTSHPSINPKVISTSYYIPPFSHLMFLKISFCFPVATSYIVFLFLIYILSSRARSAQYSINLRKICST